jgi:uncharacterized membrane protein
MKPIIYLVSTTAVCLVIYNLMQFNFENFFSEENYTSIVLILAGFSCLIIMRIMIVNEKIKKL